MFIGQRNTWIIPGTFVNPVCGKSRFHTYRQGLCYNSITQSPVVSVIEPSGHRITKI